MPSFKLPEDWSYEQEDGERRVKAIKREAFARFNPEVLGLGDIKQDSIARSAIAALFDLQGFTTFCRQIEPQLSVPIYLSGFLSFIFDAIRVETVRKIYKDGFTLWLWAV